MKFRNITVQQELQMPVLIRSLMAILGGYHVPLEESLALASNTVLLYFVLRLHKPVLSPIELFALYSLDDIATLCEEYYALQGEELDFGVGDNNDIG